jgi:2-oxoglutarate ferredoxin oxidoreductase subunit gamma
MTGIMQVRLSGLGGQGIILAGFLLGQAGATEGKYVSGSDSYGAQARGSGCKSEIILSNGPIDFPHLTSSDILVAMSQGAYQTYCKDVKREGFIFYDNGFVTPEEGLTAKQRGVSATEMSIKKLKNKQVANIILLGVMIEITRIVSPKSIQKAIALHIGERFRSLNLKALRIGIELGKKIDV